MSEYLPSYYVYIVTNFTKTTLYTGITNNLKARLVEHWDNRKTNESFTGKYKCFNLIYYEAFISPSAAIAREKEIKKWSRDKKEALIRKQNPDYNFLNKKISGEWPPGNSKRRI